MAARIAITGIGVISTFGVGRDVFWDHVSRGVSGTRAITDDLFFSRAGLDPARVRRYSFEDGHLVLLLVPPYDAPAARATLARSPYTTPPTR